MTGKAPKASDERTASKAWLRALELTAPIARRPQRIFPTVIEELAERQADAPALLSDGLRLNFGELARHARRYARWALGQSVSKGDVVCLLMPNCPAYLAIWLGISRIGGVVSLLNTSLKGSQIAHCINIVAPAHVIVAGELIDALEEALPELQRSPSIWVHGEARTAYPRVDLDMERQSGETLSAAEAAPPTVADLALHIYTSGTTGLPKAANVSHLRLMQWSHWFAGLMGTGPGDRMYNCLPMYHSVGGVLATGAVLVGGGSVVIREGFSAHGFWNDVRHWDCTLFQYIGELCRYLLGVEPRAEDSEHRIRMCCGNGLRPDVWRGFQARFRIPKILEFYAATEGNVSLFNVEGRPGAIGRVPSYLAHRFPAALVKFDYEAEQPLRDLRGRCLPCAVDEVGEAIGKIPTRESGSGSPFEGYTSKEASESKVLRDVFDAGDAWFRTGDLMRKDAQGYFYFVDRIGETFRWKGENVSTSEVAAVIGEFPGIKEASVYGVPIPGTDGKAGMAALVADGEPDLAALHRHLAARLPAYACPLFLRLRDALEVTATLKHSKQELVREGYDPRAVSDPLYFNDGAQRSFVPLDAALHARIVSGRVRV
ncbi:MAG: long-chain-acyl-CoA synthetase [Burkholderiales bacterium]